MLDSASQNGLVYTLDEDYWGTTVLGHTPGPKQVEFVYLGDEQTVALSLASNEIDVVDIGILSAGTFQQIAGENRGDHGLDRANCRMPGQIPARAR